MRTILDDVDDVGGCGRWWAMVRTMISTSTVRTKALEEE